MGVYFDLDTGYTGVVSVTVRPNPESILHGEWARFIFVAGRLCIDFTQTGGETGLRATWERFHQPSDVADWFSESPLYLQGIQVSREEFLAALSLREAIWRAAHAISQGAAPLTEDIDTINHVAATPNLSPQLTQDGLEQIWQLPGTAAAALSTIGRDAVDLFSGELRSRIRTCANPKCELMFVDASRPGRRRWCLMKRCGNITKTARYRKSKKD